MSESVFSSTPENFVLLAKLVEIDQLEDVATLKRMESFFRTTARDIADPVDPLKTLGDQTVLKLVEWTRRVPYLNALPSAILETLLHQRWHLILLLSTRYVRAIRHADELARHTQPCETTRGRRTFDVFV